MQEASAGKWHFVGKTGSAHALVRGFRLVSEENSGLFSWNRSRGGHPGLHTDSYEFPDALIEPAVSVLKAIVGLNC